MRGLFILFAILTNSVYAESGHFRYNLNVNPETLNPITTHDNYSNEILPWIAESLLRRDPKTYEWRPSLATAFEMSKDKKAYTFTLREGVKFHDGTPLTAEDVEFSLNVYGTNLYGAANQRPSLENMEKVEVLDKYKLRITMKTPKFDSLHSLATVPIVPKATYGNKDNVARMNKTVIATGPYRLKEYQDGVRLILEANPDWWGRSEPYFKDKYNFKKITIRFGLDDEYKILAVQKGDIDYATISMTAYLTRTSGADWGKKYFAEKVENKTVATTQNSFFINLRKPIFKDKRVRQALQLLFNREDMNQKFQGGLSILATGPWSRLNEYADHEVLPLLFDPKKASELLKQAGWKDSDQDGILDKEIDGKKVDFKFSVLIAARDWEKYMTIYQSDLQKAGIKLDIVQQDWPLFVKNLDSQNFDAYIIGRGFPGVIDFDPLAEWHSSQDRKNGNNPIGFRNARADKLLEKAQVEFDRKKRIKLLAEVYRIAAEEQSQVFMFSGRYFFYVRSARVKFERPSQEYSLGIEDWKVVD